MVSSDSAAVVATRQWVERVVVGLNLCPFARPVLTAQTLRIVSETSDDDDVLFRRALREIDRLQCSPASEIATTLLVFSHGLSDFQDYLNFVDALDEALRAGGLQGLVQIASFHPDYRFAEADPDDPANYSNRSPYPMVHFIREDELERALLDFPDPQQIPQSNIQRLRKMGVAAIENLIKGSEHD